MDSFMIFWGFSILLFVSVLAGLVYLSYSIPKRMGKRKLGIWLSATFIAWIFTLIITTAFEDKLFFKSDVSQRLKEHGVVLGDDFQISSNKSGGFNDYFHQFVLTITPKDKERLIKQITKGENYSGFQEMFDLREGKIRYSDKDTSFTANYENKWDYIFEYYKPNKSGYAPTWDKISISKTENELRFERVYD